MLPLLTGPVRPPEVSFCLSVLAVYTVILTILSCVSCFVMLSIGVDVALKAEEGTPSPFVKGMTREQSDRLQKDLCQQMASYVTMCTTEPKAAEKTKAKLEGKIGEQLQMLGWRYRKASWSSEWWAEDECWVAPWVDTMGKFCVTLSELTFSVL